MQLANALQVQPSELPKTGFDYSLTPTLFIFNLVCRGCPTSFTPYLAYFGNVFAINSIHGFLSVSLICEQENESVMFNSISWSQYIISIVLLLVLYYLLVGFKYFHWEILGLIGIRKVDGDTIVIPAVHNQASPPFSEKHEDYLPKPALEIDISPVVQSFTDEVKAYLQEADNKIQHGELLNSLQLIASKYPALKEADCRQELEQLILTEASTQYPHLLQPNDLKQLWS